MNHQHPLTRLVPRERVKARQKKRTCQEYGMFPNKPTHFSDQKHLGLVWLLNSRKVAKPLDPTRQQPSAGKKDQRFACWVATEL